MRHGLKVAVQKFALYKELIMPLFNNIQYAFDKLVRYCNVWLILQKNAMNFLIFFIVFITDPYQEVTKKLITVMLLKFAISDKQVQSSASRETEPRLPATKVANTDGILSQPDRQWFKKHI